MDHSVTAIAAFLDSTHPYDNLAPDERLRLARSLHARRYETSELIYRIDEPLTAVFILMEGEVETTDRHGNRVSLLGPRETFGERGFLRDGHAATTAFATRPSLILHLPAPTFRQLLGSHESVRRYFSRARRALPVSADFNTHKVSELLTRAPLSCLPSSSVGEAARLMREHHVSSLGVVAPGTDDLVGILTIRDIASRVVAEGLDAATPVSQVMTAQPISLSPNDLGSDILRNMLEHRVGHLPVVEQGRYLGMVTQTDVTRFQALGAAALLRDITQANDVGDMAAVARRIPALLVQMVGASHPHEVITRVITDITDAITRCLIKMAQSELGPPPTPFLWLACGSQGRQEQSGVTDQDNCLILHDDVTAADMPYFARLARIVCDGLNACGYVYCPGDMMATNPRWCQPLRVWREYFHSWAVTHEPQSQMLASVMFDLRPISGATELFRDLQEETLEKASKNSIFVAHMIGNSLKHTPPLGLIRGFAVPRSGPKRGLIDMKHNGVVPVTDLARVYALQGRITDVNTRARLLTAVAAGVLSATGARDLVEAYDVIAMLRLQRQADMVKYGRPITNDLAPADLSDFERNHLRDAFVVVRTMQSALGQAHGVPR